MSDLRAGYARYHLLLIGGVFESIWGTSTSQIGDVGSTRLNHLTTAGGLEERKKRRGGTRREKAISQRQIRDTYRNSSSVENQAFMAWSDQIWHLLQMK